MAATELTQARAALLAALAHAGLDVDEVGEDRWTTILEGEWKRTIPVLLELGDRRLTVTSLLTGVLDEGHAQVYRLLLQRNQRSGPVHFALDDAGDVILTGTVPLAAVDEATVDELLGRLLETADGTFNQVLRTGFASYLAAEQRWRAAAGLPPNPVGDPAPPTGDTLAPDDGQ
ncbi:MAG: YbjN domain-containing protein [Gemmatimonadota bacterium]